jgi:DNA-binding transcriptional ArsR family regulator
MEQLKEYVKFLRALGSEERLNILEAIEERGAMTVTEVEKMFFMEQSTASHHLNMMKKSNILRSRKEGRFVYYEPNNEYLDTFYRGLISSLNEKAAKKIAEAEAKKEAAN